MPKRQFNVAKDQTYRVETHHTELNIQSAPGAVKAGIKLWDQLKMLNYVDVRGHRVEKYAVVWADFFEAKDLPPKRHRVAVEEIRRDETDPRAYTYILFYHLWGHEDFHPHHKNDLINKEEVKKGTYILSNHADIWSASCISHCLSHGDMRDIKWEKFLNIRYMSVQLIRGSSPWKTLMQRFTKDIVARLPPDAQVAITSSGREAPQPITRAPEVASSSEAATGYGKRSRTTTTEVENTPAPKKCKDTGNTTAQTSSRRSVGLSQGLAATEMDKATETDVDFGGRSTADNPAINTPLASKADKDDAENDSAKRNDSDKVCESGSDKVRVKACHANNNGVNGRADQEAVPERFDKPDLITDMYKELPYHLREACKVYEKRERELKERLLADGYGPPSDT